MKIGGGSHSTGRKPATYLEFFICVCFRTFRRKMSDVSNVSESAKVVKRKKLNV
jgi:hypothetical protein